MVFHLRAGSSAFDDRMLESALVELYAQAGGPGHGVALAAVGSLARRELGPRSDIDLVLLHDGRDRSRIDALAEPSGTRCGTARCDWTTPCGPRPSAPTWRAESSAPGSGCSTCAWSPATADWSRAPRTAAVDRLAGNARKRLPELLAVAGRAPADRSAMPRTCWSPT